MARVGWQQNLTAVCIGWVLLDPPCTQELQNMAYQCAIDTPLHHLLSHCCVTMSSPLSQLILKGMTARHDDMLITLPAYQLTHLEQRDHHGEEEHEGHCEQDGGCQGEGRPEAPCYSPQPPLSHHRLRCVRIEPQLHCQSSDHQDAAGGKQGRPLPPAAGEEMTNCPVVIRVDVGAQRHDGMMAACLIW
jgi:hypothetical protein